MDSKMENPNVKRHKVYEKILGKDEDVKDWLDANLFARSWSNGLLLGEELSVGKNESHYR